MSNEILNLHEFLWRFGVFDTPSGDIILLVSLLRERALQSSFPRLCVTDQNDLTRHGHFVESPSGSHIDILNLKGKCKLNSSVYIFQEFV